MQLNNIGSNKTELHLNGANILFSYNTPVACWIEGQFYKTNKKWSQTTSKHINSWVHLAVEKDQEFFDNLIKGV
jgi:hypothetical protein